MQACHDAPVELLSCPVAHHQGAHDFFLTRDAGLALQPALPVGARALRVDFTAGKNAHRRRFGGGRQQDLARACGLNRHPDLTILDATAGLGRDAFVLASLGAEVTLAECQPVVWALLRDGLDRLLASDNRDEQAIGERMTLIRARAGIEDLPVARQSDVIYLDPMFPERRKSAAVKLDMQLLHRLAGPGSPVDETTLLSWAVAAEPARVVVKRPRVAPMLDGQAPSHQLLGKSNRFDVYALRRIRAGWTGNR